MYESNRQPLPAGTLSEIFAKQLASLQQQFDSDDSRQMLTPDSVVRWADKQHRPLFTKICRRLLLPDSRIVGLDQLRKLTELAQEGQSCLLCLNHRSNLDVPTLLAMLTDFNATALFDRLIWIAGRKLEEDQNATSQLIKGFNRVLVTPHSWFNATHSKDQIGEAKRINMAAERSMLELRHEGWVFSLFPTGTRLRPNDESSKHAIAETDSYLRAFDNLLLCHISGCTLPVSQDHAFINERPQLDRMVYTFGTVQRTSEWRERMARADGRQTPRLGPSGSLRSRNRRSHRDSGETRVMKSISTHSRRPPLFIAEKIRSGHCPKKAKTKLPHHTTLALCHENLVTDSTLPTRLNSKLQSECSHLQRPHITTAQHSTTEPMLGRR
ncbi:MAG: 1-acyl-sn-glycerol-3-phosphate acyltransferase [Rubripirellula sp.]|nr:1-acyl-sn-glycerol-3-phosphate acyltransferase [Rubripirellula sp.]